MAGDPDRSLARLRPRPLFDCANFQEFREHFFAHFHPNGNVTLTRFLTSPLGGGDDAHETDELQRRFYQSWRDWGGSTYRPILHRALERSSEIRVDEIANVVSFGLGRLHEPRSMRQLAVMVDLMHRYPDMRGAHAVDPAFQDVDLRFLHELGINATNQAGTYDDHINANTLFYAPGLPIAQVPAQKLLHVRPPMLVHSLVLVYAGVLAQCIIHDLPLIGELCEFYKPLATPGWPTAGTRRPPSNVSGADIERYANTEFATLIPITVWVLQRSGSTKSTRELFLRLASLGMDLRNLFKGYTSKPEKLN
ncbi:MAG: hypothetical protein Q9159_000845 [Coniocarpon cinnabarinum]